MQFVQYSFILPKFNNSDSDVSAVGLYQTVCHQRIWRWFSSI